MCNLKLVFTITVISICLKSIDAVSFINKCKWNDTKCLKESSQAVIPLFAAGMKEYGIEPLDPFIIKYVEANIPHLKHSISNTTLTGLKDCLAKKIVIEKTKSKILLKFLCSCQIDGQYEMSGRLLVLPIEGKGPMHVTLRKIEISVEGDLIEKSGDENKYWQVKNWKHSFALKDKSDVVYENLFNGNKVLGAAARDIISQSGNEIIKEVGPKIIKHIVETVIERVNKLFSRIPANELTID